MKIDKQAVGKIIQHPLLMRYMEYALFGQGSKAALNPFVQMSDSEFAKVTSELEARMSYHQRPEYLTPGDCDFMI